MLILYKPICHVFVNIQNWFPTLQVFFPFPLSIFQTQIFLTFSLSIYLCHQDKVYLTPHLFWSNNGNFIFRFRRKSTECWHSVFAYFHFWKFKRSILTRCSNALLISQKGSDFLPQTELIFYAVRRTQWRTAATWW